MEIKTISLQEFAEMIGIDYSKSKSVSMYYDILYHISTTLFKERMSRGMSMKEFANVLGVTPAMVSKYENGDYNFSLRQLCDVCEKLEWKLGFGLIKEETV